MIVFAIILLLVFLVFSSVAFVPNTRQSRVVVIVTKLSAHQQSNLHVDEARRKILTNSLMVSAGFVLSSVPLDCQAAEDDSDIGPVPKEAYVKLPSGVVYADLKPGTGEQIQGGSRVNMQWVLRKSNGYFVDSSDVSGGVPFIFNVGDGNAIAGVDEGVRGMREGGIRRLLIPPRLAYVDGLEDGKPGPLPVGYGPRQQMRRVQTVRADVPGEYVFLEVKVTRVR